jgi:polysaccharide export outer membrane protein
MKDAFIRSSCVAVLLAASASTAAAQAPTAAAQPVLERAADNTAGVALPTGYVIGAEDFLSVVFWREKDLSAEVIVRPDGKISLPLLNDIQAAGYTPEQLAGVVARAASKYVADPLATVIVKQINSRKVFVLGAVSKPGTFLLTSDMNVLQLIAQVGGLLEYADSENIIIIRKQAGREQRLKFNYDEVIKGKKIEQNITLQPGDTILVR